MKRSTSHILTTHTGSLPRSPALQELLRLREERQSFDPATFAEGVRTAVSTIVQKQLDTGLDVINDGEQGRSQYAAYVKERLTGFDGERQMPARASENPTSPTTWPRINPPPRNHSSQMHDVH
jgi:5-methyltetrahydropteroyltriglutamate--homocysteine methyltransferase